METIRLFMWGYQRHFQHSVQVAAEKLFKTLHPEFEVETFLLGLARKTAPDIHPVCLEPEDCGFQPSHFESVREAAAHYRAIDPENGLICMAESHQKSHSARVQHRAVRNAVLAVLNGWRGQKIGDYFFLGLTPVAEYEVGVVLRLYCTAAEKPYAKARR